MGWARSIGPQAGPGLRLCVGYRDGQVAAVMAPKGHDKHRNASSQGVERYQKIVGCSIDTRQSLRGRGHRKDSPSSGLDSSRQRLQRLQRDLVGAQTGRVVMDLAGDHEFVGAGAFDERLHLLGHCLG